MNTDHLKRLFGLLAALNVSACGDETATHDTITQVSQTIGPAGGVLIGPDDSALAGVRLEFPPAALAAEVSVTIAVFGDPTLLPPKARGVGISFRVGTGELGGGDLPLTTPASLTLPVLTEAVASYGKLAEDVKVWVRDGDGWKLVPPTATASGSVTIPIDGTTLAAAGVQITPQDPSCTDCTMAQCPGTSGFCVETLGFPPFLSGPMALSGNTLHYVPDATGTSLFARRWSLDTRSELASSTSIANVASAKRWRPLLIDPVDQSVWAASYDGTLNFRFGTASVRYDLGRSSLGATLTGSGRLLRHVAAISGKPATGGRYVRSSTGSFSSLYPFPKECGEVNQVLSDRSKDLDAFYFVCDIGGVARSARVARIGYKDSTVAEVADFPGAVYHFWLRASAPDGSLVAVRNDDLEQLELRHGKAAFQPIAITLADLAEFDAKGGLWFLRRGVPEVFYVDGNNGVSSAALPDLATQTTALMVHADGSAIIATSTGALLRVRRQ